MTSMTSSSSSTHSRRRHPTHAEPPPVTYHDDRALSARLNRAILTSNIQSVRRLLDNTFNPDGSKLDPRNPDPVTKKTSLILATETADLEICRILINDYEVEKHSISKDIDNNTVIHLAASNGLDEIIKLYHSHYPEVLDWPNSDGMTPLHVASQKGHESTVSLLLDLQADVELTDNEGNTALHYAAGWGHLKIVLLLIDRGSPFWAKNNQTFTASDYAFSFSIQSALQESARAHFESKKSQSRHQNRKPKDREKDRSRVTGSGTLANAGSTTSSSTAHVRSNSPQSSATRTNRLRLEESVTNAPSRSTSMPQVITTPPANKASNSPAASTNQVSKKRPTPLVALSHPIALTNKPIPSPTNSIATARTVSHLISKDLEAIEDFRARSYSLASTATSNNSPSLTNQTSSSDSPTTSSMSRLIPLQLVTNSSSSSGGGGGQSSRNSIVNFNSSSGINSASVVDSSSSHYSGITNNLRSRSRSSTENVRGSVSTVGKKTLSDGRNRAASTESEFNLASSSSSSSTGPREGLSRLRYLKRHNNSSNSVINSSSSNLNSNN